MKCSKGIRLVLHGVLIFMLYVLTPNFGLLVYQIFPNSSSVLLRFLNVLLTVFSTFYVVYLYSRYILKEPMQTLFLGKPFPSLFWIIIAIFMPLFICLFYLVFTDGVLQRGNLSPEEIINVLAVSVLSDGIREGIVDEVFLRGFIFGYVHKKRGTTPALIASNLFCLFLIIIDIIFDIIVTNQVDICSTVLFAVSSIVTHSALSLVTLQTGSIWSSVVIHIFYNILGGGSQILQINTEPHGLALWTYTLKTDNILLSGIHSIDSLSTALPAITGFLVIGIIAVINIIRSRNTSQNPQSPV